MNKTNLTIVAVTFAVLADSAFADGPLQWMAGDWCAQSDGERVEERWLASTSNLMLGVNRTVVGGHTSAFEFLRIRLHAGGAAEYLPQPGGRPATPFAMTGNGPRWVRFENPEHDFPQLIEYRRESDRLTASIAGPGEGGEEMKFSFEFNLCEKDT